MNQKLVRQLQLMKQKLLTEYQHEWEMENTVKELTAQVKSKIEECDQANEEKAREEKATVEILAAE